MLRDRVSFQAKELRAVSNDETSLTNCRACMAGKTFPTLAKEAKEVTALDRYLSEIEDPKIAFFVRQQRPETLEEVVASTLEMEFYAAFPDKGAEANVSLTVVEDLDEHDLCNVRTQPGTDVPALLHGLDCEAVGKLRI
ncbi:hypothetical protein EMCRGX_G002117 [Ephydatia muelleri]